jgi:hypothetical protein
MTQASQRHKNEVHDMADSQIIPDGALTFTFTGQFVEGLEILLHVGGDVSNLTSRTRLANGMTATEAAAAATVDLTALTGVSATSLAGVITIAVEAPNTAVTADKAEFHHG